MNTESDTIAGDGQLNLVTALACEAKPLIEHFELHFMRSHAGFTVYENDRDITLIICGTGKSAIATGCGWLAAGQQNHRETQAAWINIGIAGHADLNPGTGFIAHKVTDVSAGKSFYPFLQTSAIASVELLTVDRPELEYDGNAAFDMEGSSFCSSAGRFVPNELIQLFKVVSDNRTHSSKHVTSELVESLIRQNLEIIDSLAEQMHELSAQYNSIYALPVEYTQISKQVRLTVSQHSQFRKLYRQYYALGGENLAQAIVRNKQVSGKELLGQLKSLISTL